MASRGMRISPTGRYLHMALGLCLVGLPTLCHAKNNCAWINEATAGGLLGGASVGAFTAADAAQPAICVFTYEDAGIKRILRVTVEVVADSHARLMTLAQTCGKDAVPVKAIGNEAIVCAADERKGVLGERIVGRVRDQVFTITLSSTVKDDPLLTRDALETRTYTAAEQVSGNLF